MEIYLFRFGYLTPEQWVANNTKGWDDESSGCFYIRAATSKEALVWGREVVNKIVEEEFVKHGLLNVPDWKSSDFAHWIEEDSVLSECEIGNFPVINIGEFPTKGVI